MPVPGRDDALPGRDLPGQLHRGISLGELRERRLRLRGGLPLRGLQRPAGGLRGGICLQREHGPVRLPGQYAAVRGWPVPDQLPLPSALAGELRERSLRGGGELQLRRLRGHLRHMRWQQRLRRGLRALQVPGQHEPLQRRRLPHRLRDEGHFL